MKTPDQPFRAVAENARVTPQSPGQRASLNSGGLTHLTQNRLAQDGEIASRACKIWQEQGCPEGFGEMQWRLAQQEIPGVSSGGCAA